MKVLNMIGRAGLLAVLVPLTASAQLGEPGWRVTMQTTNGWGDHTPLWQNANRYGMGSTQKNNGYLQAGVYSPVPADSVRRWGFGYGLSLVGAWRAVSPFYVQEAYAEARWLKGTLTVGSKEYPMELKNNRLSSGSQTLGINARPVPQVRLALPRYWTFAKGWLGLKGHIAYGIATGGSADLRTRQLTYSVYTDLLQLRGSGTEILMRFRHTADSLTVYEPYTGGWCQPDYVLEDVSLLYPYGIRRLREGFRVERLDGSRLVLRSPELRLHLRKY